MRAAVLMCPIALPVNVCNIELFVTQIVWHGFHFYFAALFYTKMFHLYQLTTFASQLSVYLCFK